MLKKWLSVVVIIGLTAAACGFILAGADEDMVAGQSFKPPGVAIARLAKTDYRLKIPARGIVRAGEYADVRSEIQGKIKTVSSRVYAGAKVEKGELLFSLEDRQYRLQIREAEAVCRAAEQALHREQGRQIVARRQWQMLAPQKKVSDQERQLALRRPQLITCRAELEKARARRDLLQYDLERTRIQSPCSGIILEESVSPGLLIGPETAALRLACTHTYQIAAKFASHQTPDPARQEVTITIGKETRPGRIKSILPGCDPETGQRAALVELKSNTPDILNQYASLTLKGKRFSNVYVFDRDALRPDSTVWLLDKDNTLAIAPVTLLGKDRRHAVVRGLNPADRLIRSHLSNPLAGMALHPLAPAAGETQTEKQ